MSENASQPSGTASHEQPSAVSLEAADDEISLLDLLLVVAENIRLLLFGSFGAGLVAFGLTFVTPPTYTATTRILPPQQQQSTAAMLASQLGALSDFAGGLIIKNPSDTYIGFVMSRTVADRLVDRFDLLTVYATKSREDARKVLSSLTKVSSGRDGLITIEVDDESPRRAADMANAYVQELVGLTGSIAITEAQQRRVFFENQLKQAQENLKKAERALEQVGASENLIKSAPQAVVESIARLKAQVTAQEVRLATMRGSVTEQSPQFQTAQRELASLRFQLSQAERTQPLADASAGDYLNRYRDFKYQEALYEMMARQYHAARLDESREGATVQIVDPAIVPERTSRPKRTRIVILATMATGFALLLFVFARESLRRGVTDPERSGKLARIARGFRRLFSIQ